VFDDLRALRQLTPASTRRARSTETFARIPYGRARALVPHDLTGSAWQLLIELDRLILEGHGRNPVKLTNQSQKAIGLTRGKRERALCLLKDAGVITVERRPGQALLVTHKWYPITCEA
jgi:hypothetical protein